MEREYVITRLRALRLRFPTPMELSAMLQKGGAVAEHLLDTAFAPEMRSAIDAGAHIGTLHGTLRLIDKSVDRLRRKFIDFVKMCDEELGAAFAMGWELASVKSAALYIASDGFSFDPRYEFLSFAGSASQWGSRKTVAEFAETLRDTNHPLAPGVSPELYAKDPAAAEHHLDKYFYKTWLNENWRLPGEVHEYYLRQLDMLNIRNAAFSIDGGEEAIERYIRGGSVTATDFMSVVHGETGAAEVVRTKLNIAISDADTRSPHFLTMGILRELCAGYKRKVFFNPMTVWEFVYFLARMELCVVNLKLAASAIFSGAEPEFTQV